MDASHVAERYRKGVWLFNRRYFFECHEVLEAEWLESTGREKLFYQMLIQAAVVFVHWENGNRRGVLALEHSFQQKTARLGCDVCFGLDVAHLRRELRALVEPLRQNAEAALPSYNRLEAPLLHVTGFEPLECAEEELRVLGRREAE